VHDEDDIVAVDPETSESAPIRHDDIVLWQLDAETLLNGMSSARGLVNAPSSVGMGNRLWWLGELIVADATFAMYLATTRSAADLNLLDGRTKKPNLQWQLLRAFGIANGHIGWKKGNTSKEYQKRKETLAKSLAAFFGIEGEPIVLDGKDWKCRFRVVASDD